MPVVKDKIVIVCIAAALVIPFALSKIQGFHFAVMSWKNIINIWQLSKEVLI